MLDDFNLIHHSFKDVPYLNIYPIGDVHIGSAEFNEEHFREFVKVIQHDDYGRVVIIGDMMNMGLRNSKSNVYEEKLNPYQQKELCYELLKPIKDKILCGCSGNHEYRAVKEVGTNPLYDVFCRLQKEDLYRENICFIKLTVGETNLNPNVYGLVATHGSTKNKDEKWTYAVDNCDCFISGHTHTISHVPLAKIKMDLSHNKVKMIPYQHIVVKPFQEYGGYAVRGKFLPTFIPNFQKVTFRSCAKKVEYHYS